MKVFDVSHAITAAFVLFLTLSPPAAAQTSESPATEPAKEAPPRPKLERATFGGGCFWCLEAVYDHVPGVRATISGFAGGNVPHPSYQMVCTGLTGHAEVVQVVFDPKVVSYEKLLTIFFKAHDPTTPNMQGDDVGTQYRSIILYHSDAQKAAAQKYYAELTARKAFRHPIVTELVPMTVFFPAEEYHQDYYLNHRGDNYSTMYIEPKLRKLRPAFRIPMRSP